MLVMTRSRNQSITIGDDSRVVVVNVESGRVRPGIDAPRTVRVWRGELREDATASSKEKGKSKK